MMMMIWLVNGRNRVEKKMKSVFLEFIKEEQISVIFVVDIMYDHGD